MNEQVLLWLCVVFMNDALEMMVVVVVVVVIECVRQNTKLSSEKVDSSKQAMC